MSGRCHGRYKLTVDGQVEGPGEAFYQGRDTEGAMDGCSSEWVDQEGQEEDQDDCEMLQVR
jgi:hypothetical protein